jgi:hypothetical protein
MAFTPTSAPRGHIWCEQLQAWVKPIPRQPGRRPSDEHVLCTAPMLCWVLMR